MFVFVLICPIIELPKGTNSDLDLHLSFLKGERCRCDISNVAQFYTTIKSLSLELLQVFQENQNDWEYVKRNMRFLDLQVYLLVIMREILLITKYQRQEWNSESEDDGDLRKRHIV